MSTNLERLSISRRSEITTVLLNEQLFVILLPPLKSIEKECDDLSPSEFWLEAKALYYRILDSQRPELMVPEMLNGLTARYSVFMDGNRTQQRSREEALQTATVVAFVLMYMLASVHRPSQDDNPYRPYVQALADVIKGHEIAHWLWQEVRAKEDAEEQVGRYVGVVHLDAAERPADADGVLNYFAPTNSLKRFLNDLGDGVEWQEGFDEAWIETFVEELMQSEWRDVIARGWAVKGARDKKTMIKAYVVGLLCDAQAFKGVDIDGKVKKANYNTISKVVNNGEEQRTIAKYMSDGKKQPYASWVLDYVENSMNRTA